MPKRSKRKWLKWFICCLCLFLVVVVYVELKLVLNIANTFLNGDHTHLRDVKKPQFVGFNYSVSLITVCDYSQLHNLFYIVNAWMDSISVGLGVFSTEMDYIDEAIKEMHLPSRVTISKLSSYGNSFRINALRNLALSKASTTHVFIADADILPACTQNESNFDFTDNLRDTFLSLPFHLLHDSAQAFIVPLFDVPFKSIPCKTWVSCIQPTNQYLRMNKNQLVWCLRFGGCRSLGEKDSNMYLPKDWSQIPPTNHTIPLHCWDNPFQEPFVIVSKTNLPLFDEEFVDYGYNKIQWISLLRYSGYKFTVLSNSWAFHMRHSPSIYQRRSKEKSDPTQGKKGGVNTKKIYDRVIKKYESEFANVYRLPICTVQTTTVVVPDKKAPVRKGGKKRIVRKSAGK